MSVFGNEDNYNIVIKTSGDTDGVNKVEKALGSLSGAASSSMGSFLKMSGAVAAGEAAFNLAKDAIGKTVGFLESTVKSADESENVMAQLNAVLASTKGVAGVTASEVDKLSHALQKTTTYSDEQVTSAQSMLLTFTNIGKKVFPDTTKAVLDMATAMHEDLQTNAIRVGKALQDPVLGVTALQKAGVRLTESQKDLVKQMVAVGDTAGAQQLILKELQTEFGGSAEAAGKTFTGSLARLKNQMDDVKEKIGDVIVHALEPFATKAATALNAIDWNRVIDRTLDKLSQFW